MKYALQLYSVRTDMQEDFEGTLKKVKQMGYEGVEFAGMFGKSAAEVKKMCEEIGLVPISAHVPFVELLEEDSLKYYSELGCKYVAIPYLTEEYRPGNAKFDETIAGAKKICKYAEKYNIKICYHNHDFEFVKLDNEYALDRIYRLVPDLYTEIDTCWAAVSGVDPAEYILKYAERTEIVHIKDFVGSKTENMFELIGIKSDKKSDTSGKFQFRPVGYGVQDVPAIIAAAEKAGAEWSVVEMDEPALDKTRLECAKMSIDYIKSVS